MWRLCAIVFVGLGIYAAKALLLASGDERGSDPLAAFAAQPGHGKTTVGSSPQVGEQIGPSGIPAPIEVTISPPPVPTEVARSEFQSHAARALDAAAKLLADTPADADPQGASSGDRTMVAKLQSQLRRVGCFKGALHGRWDAATQRAMARFNDRINARIPLDDPSPILLTLLEKYDNRACGAPCLPGQSPNGAGICVTAQTVAMAIPVPLTEAVAVPVPAPATKIQRLAAKALATPAAVSPSGASRTAGKSNDWTPTSVALAVTKPSIGRSKTATPAAPTTVVAENTGSIFDATGNSPVAQAGFVADTSVPPDPATGASARTTIVALPPGPHKKRHARKTSGWGNSQVALGAAPWRRRQQYASVNWLENLLPAYVVPSRRFVGAPSGSSAFAGEPMAIVLSRN